MSKFQAKANSFLIPDWPAPSNIAAFSTIRIGGFSDPPWDSFNLGSHVGDDPKRVRENRDRLSTSLNLPSQPVWLEQVHGIEVVDAENPQTFTADAIVAHSPAAVCTIMTADCLPVLLCDRDGTAVGAAHGGWRGLHSGVLLATVSQMNAEPENMLAWLGPAIGPAAFEVGSEVRESFLDVDTSLTDCFKPTPSGRWLADIYAIARVQLHAVGITTIDGGDRCTHTESDRFFSYRRDGQTGRMASLIWLKD